MANGEEKKNGRLLTLVEPHFTVGNLINIIALILGLGMTWGTITSRLDAMAEQLKMHISSVELHQPAMEHYEQTTRQIERDLKPIEIKIQTIEEVLDRVERNQQEVLRLLGRVPPNTRP